MGALRDVRDIQLAPDGIHVLASITDMAADGGRPHLWLLDRVGGGMQQLTFSSSSQDKGESHGRLTADGRVVLFISDRGNGPRLFRLPMFGGEAQPLTLSRTDGDEVRSAWADRTGGAVTSAHDFEISPDGQTVAVIASDGDSAAMQENKAKKDDAVVFGIDAHARRLYLVDLHSGSSREVRLADAPTSVSWDATSNRLVVVTSPTSDDLGPHRTVWVIDHRQPDAAVAIRALPPTVNRAVWADESRIVFSAHCEEDTPTSCLDLYSYDLNSHAIIDLTARTNGNLAPNAGITPLRSGRAIVTTLEQGFEQHVAVVRLDGGVEMLDVGKPVTMAVATNQRQDGWLFLSSGPDGPPSVFYAATLGRRSVSVATPDLTPRDWKTAQPQRVAWQNQGQSIQGLLYLPDDADHRRVPMVVMVHGGPTGRFSDRYYPIVNVLVGQGWAVLGPNPRGSAGYGAAFQAANKDDLGGADFNDIMAGIDFALARYPLDGDRLALIGYSYGGEMAGFAAGKTQRFKAIVSGGPVIDQFSEYGTEESSWYDRWYFGSPLERFEAAWRQSPLSYLSRARTPVLILQGREDQTDPLGQSLEFYRALKQAGDQVQLVIYPRESHLDTYRNFMGEVSREPAHGIDLRSRMIRFIADAFGGEPTPAAPSEHR